MKIVFIISVIIVIFLIQKYHKSHNVIDKKKSIVKIENTDFFDDMSVVLDKWNINYAIENDMDDKKMMVIIRRPSDPFFAVTCKRDV
jgi:tRNA isopentenyl-2-thiomethyl-A-37 hydroxylase MiaE